MTQIVKIEQKAPRTSTRWYPKVNLLFACHCAIFKAHIEMPKPATSDAMCAASDMMAID